MAQVHLNNLTSLKFNNLDRNLPVLIKNNLMNSTLRFDERHDNFSAKIIINSQIAYAINNSGRGIKPVNQFINITANGVELVWATPFGIVRTIPNNLLDGRYDEARLGASIEYDLQCCLDLYRVRSKLGIIYSFNRNNVTETGIVLGDNKKQSTIFAPVDMFEFPESLRQYSSLGRMGYIIRTEKATNNEIRHFAVLTATGIIWRFTVDEDTKEVTNYQAVACLVI